jgi:hypothetical protein
LVTRPDAGAWQDGSVAGTSGDTGQSNVHAAWRMAEARRAAQAYQPNPKLAALAVAGSVGSGLADQFSDLELDCYWSSVLLSEARTGADLGSFREELSGRRRAIGPPLS